MHYCVPIKKVTRTRHVMCVYVYIYVPHLYKGRKRVVKYRPEFPDCFCLQANTELGPKFHASVGYF
jgi:hypothetical protein